MSPTFRPLPFSLLVVVLALLLAPAAEAAPIQLGVNTDGAPDRAASLDEYAAKVGRKPDIVMWFQDWTEPLFYSTQMEAVGSRSATPMITWTPTDVPLRSITAGERDSYLRSSARAAAASNKPMYIRFAHEMNGDWYSWGLNSANDEGDYVAAWRHVVEIFREEGATNVKWVWSPNADYLGMFPIQGLYPGDGWVDWVALDAYNWGSHLASGWRSLSTMFGPTYDQITSFTDKPFMIAETAAPEQGGDKAAWIREGLLDAVPRRMPRVKAVIWFDRNKETDWRVDSSAASLAAYRSVVASPLYGGGETSPQPSPLPPTAPWPNPPTQPSAPSILNYSPSTSIRAKPPSPQAIRGALQTSVIARRDRRARFTCRARVLVAGSIRCEVLTRLRSKASRGRSRTTVVARGARRMRAAGLAAMRAPLTRKGRTLVRRAVGLVVRVTFKPVAGAPVSVTRQIKRR